MEKATSACKADVGKHSVLDRREEAGVASTADPGRSSATAVTDPSMPATSVAVAANGVLLLDVADSRLTTRARGIPRDVRQLVRDEHLTRARTGAALGHGAAIVSLWAGLSAVGLLVGRWWMWVPIWLVQAILLRGAFAAMHDAAHGTLVRSELGNRVARQVWALPLVINPSLWRAEHLEHHRAVASEDDPEQLSAPTLVRYLVVAPARELTAIVVRWVHSLGTLFGLAPGYANRFGVHPAMHVDALLLLAVIGGLVTASILQPLLVLTLWAIPFVTYSLVVAPFFDLPDHHATGDRGSMLEVSRTVDTVGPVRWLVRDGNLHAAHHLVPSVPAGHLRRVDDALGERTVHRSPSYLRCHLTALRELRRRRRAA